jgi:3-hydroxybutyryl-CoA dehydratase
MSVERAPPSALRRQPVVGESLPALRRQVLQSTIDDYAKASGDFNPIHVDPEFARNGPFGRTIAHGLMTLSFVAQMLNDWTSGAFDECGEIDVAFIGPVFAGDTVEVSGLVEEILARDGQPVARIKLTCRVGGRDILAGSALQPFEETGKARSMG